MKFLGWPDTVHLSAAEEWIELGNYLEADAELDKIEASLRAHPDVLKVRWRVYEEAKSWETEVEIAGALVRMDPYDAGHWLMRSRALHELKRTGRRATNCSLRWSSPARGFSVVSSSNSGRMSK